MANFAPWVRKPQTIHPKKAGADTQFVRYLEIEGRCLHASGTRSLELTPVDLSRGKSITMSKLCQDLNSVVLALGGNVLVCSASLKCPSRERMKLAAYTVDVDEGQGACVRTIA